MWLRRASPDAQDSEASSAAVVFRDALKATEQPGPRQAGGGLRSRARGWRGRGSRRRESSPGPRRAWSPEADPTLKQRAAQIRVRRETRSVRAAGGSGAAVPAGVRTRGGRRGGAGIRRALAGPAGSAPPRVSGAAADSAPPGLPRVRSAAARPTLLVTRELCPSRMSYGGSPACGS